MTLSDIGGDEQRALEMAVHQAVEAEMEAFVTELQDLEGKAVQLKADFLEAVKDLGDQTRAVARKVDAIKALNQKYFHLCGRLPRTTLGRSPEPGQFFIRDEDLIQTL